MAALKLYLPYGTHHRAADARLVTFHWFCVSRKTPAPATPAELIMGYKTLTEDARARAEATVSEFLTEDEFHQLRSYLRERHGEDLRTTLLCAPVSATKPDSGTQVGLERPFAQCAPKPGSGFHRLSEEEGYTLPFEVWGYYSLPARLRAATAAATIVADDDDDDSAA